MQSVCKLASYHAMCALLFFQLMQVRLRDERKDKMEGALKALRHFRMDETGSPGSSEYPETMAQLLVFLDALGVPVVDLKQGVNGLW